MKRKHTKILFILPSLSGGGAERVVTTIVTHLDRERFEPCMVLLEKSGPYLSLIPDDIPIIDLQVSRVRYALLKIVGTIRKERPDIVFSTLGHLNLLIAAIGPLLFGDVTFIARESNTVSVENKQEKYPKLFDWLYRRLYPRFDRIVAQSRFMKEDLVVNYGIDPTKIVVIYNPVESRRILSEMEDDTLESDMRKRCRMIAVGRLSWQKGFDLLIEVMKKLPENYTLTILGEGEARKSLETQIEEMELSGRVHLAGFCPNPYHEMAQADLLVLSSRYEGLPNVVLEANVCGLPVVAFDAPGGTAELIREGENGALVEAFDIDAFASAVEKICKTSFDRVKIREKTVRDYDVGRIVKEYEALLEKG